LMRDWLRAFGGVEKSERCTALKIKGRIMQFEVFCDFDGTITRDTTDILLERLADPSWHEIEDRWVRKEIGSRECMALQVPLIQGGWNAVRRVLDELPLAAGFTRFAHWCNEYEIPLYVVSDGMDKVIEYFFQREKIKVDGIFANSVVEDENGNLQLGFPYSALGCGSGVCKCRILQNEGTATTVVIGDGRSDFCWSGNADIVFAKASLLTECRAQRRACIPFEDFHSIRMTLDSMLADPEQVAV